LLETEGDGRRRNRGNPILVMHSRLIPSNSRPSVLANTVRRALKVLRTIIGEPDYDRYVAHMRAHHPECAIASHDEFMKQRMESRYTRPGSRCC
jgi:uncharacterized short protein YbdD (DUF466 family)